MKLIDVTAGIIINELDQILLTYRPAKDNFAGGWEFPGGKIEVGETPEKCLVRELKEELGIAANIYSFCTEVTHNYPTISVRIQAYYCSILSGEIKLSVHNSFKWVEVNQLLKYELLAADIPIAIQVQEDLI